MKFIEFASLRSDSGSIARFESQNRAAPHGRKMRARIIARVFAHNKPPDTYITRQIIPYTFQTAES